MRSARINDPRPGRGVFWIGAALLGAWTWWSFGWATTFAAVSIVHWPLILPQLAIETVPAFTGGFAGAAMLLGRPVARQLLIVFAVTVFHAAVLTAVAPEIHDRYRQTLRQSESILRTGG